MLRKIVNGCPCLQSVRSHSTRINTSSKPKTYSFVRKKNVHNIKRDYIITYFTKNHENDAVSVRLWVEEMKKKGDLNPVLYYKHQGSIDSTVPHFTINDFCLIIMTPLQSELFKKIGKR